LVIGYPRLIMLPPCQKTVTSASGVTFRCDVQPGDVNIVRELVLATGKFYEDEVEIAVELVEERLNRGSSSGYEFVFVHKLEHNNTSNEAVQAQVDDDTNRRWDAQGPVIGFACYGRIPCTRQAYDLYWIAVHPTHQGLGLGHQLLTEVERSIRHAGGTQLYADTSGRSDYETTRRFYLATQFEQAACLADFYAPGDDKIIFRKLV
jgi:ribosomal protein S18 acetylase RimI-like enzyme